MRLVSVTALLLAMIAAPVPAHAAPADLLPRLEPVRSDLSKWDIRKQGGHVYLRFTGTIANVGEGGLHVIGKRERRDNTLTAYQHLDGSNRDIRIGTMVYHAEHNHFHLEGVARYRLLDSHGHVVEVAPKVTFCLRDDYVVDSSSQHFRAVPGYLNCTPNPNAEKVEMGISAGWADVYGKDLEGQSFDVTDLPKGEYTLEMTTNPAGIIIEANRSHPKSVSVKVTL